MKASTEEEQEEKTNTQPTISELIQALEKAQVKLPQQTVKQRNVGLRNYAQKNIGGVIKHMKTMDARGTHYNQSVTCGNQERFDNIEKGLAEIKNAIN